MKRRIRLALFLAAILAVVSGCEGSGDRVLVSKFQYSAHLTDPKRFEVVVFKYPKAPVENNVPKNYIKRLLGLPGEIIAIFFGRLFRWAPEPGEAPPYDDVNDPAINPLNLWDYSYMHVGDEKGKQLFEAGKFEPIRKPPAIMLALRRIVNDNDFQPADLKGKLPPRWNPAAASSWKVADADNKILSHAGIQADKVDWLRYQHIRRDQLNQPVPRAALITDAMDYNSFDSQRGSEDPLLPPGPIEFRTPSPNWVGDLLIECKLTVDKAEGEFWMELSKGINRFQARWELKTGTCTLYRHGPDGKQVELAQKTTRMKAPGNYQLRLANFDARLTVWVDSELPFGDGQDYPPPEVRGKGEENLDQKTLEKRRGPTLNDLEPASLGSKGAAVQVHNLRLWRDSYYTLDPSRSGDASPDANDWTGLDIKNWEPLRNLEYKTMYVQPGHYLCLGDNSPSSSDSRQWGLVPDRLMLGRALMVYFPLDRIGPIR